MGEKVTLCAEAENWYNNDKVNRELPKGHLTAASVEREIIRWEKSYCLMD